MSELRFAVVGFGMAGLGAVHALLPSLALQQHPTAPASSPCSRPPRAPAARPRPTTSAPSSSTPTRSIPFDRILDDLGVETHPVREDYELVRLTLGNSTVVGPATFGAALTALREALGDALARTPFATLDAVTVDRFLDNLLLAGRIDADGRAAMRQRMLLEDGTTRLSALAYALSLAKTPTPVRRLEVKHGLYRVAARARDAALAAGVTFFQDARVHAIDIDKSAVRLHWRRGDDLHTQSFDASSSPSRPSTSRPSDVSGFRAAARRAHAPAACAHHQVEPRLQRRAGHRGARHRALRDVVLDPRRR